MRSLSLSRRILRTGIVSVLIALGQLATMSPTFALDTATITGSVFSPDCIEYRVRGICYWLR